MKLGLGKAGAGAAQGKQNVLVAILLIAVIGGAGFFVYRTMMGSRTPTPEMGEGQIPPGPGGPGGDWGGMPGMPPGGAPPGPAGGPATAAPGAAPGMPPGAEAPAPPPPARPTAAPPATSPAPAPERTPAAARPQREMEMRRMKVFGTVSISYPASWKISAGGTNSSAVFTDGSAVFEVHPPNPKAASAKAIAQSAMRSMAAGASVLAQGSDKVSGYDAYWISAKQGARTMRIVGVDGPTRVALLEYVRNGQFASYRDVFNKMQSGITFETSAPAPPTQ